MTIDTIFEVSIVSPLSYSNTIITSITRITVIIINIIFIFPTPETLIILIMIMNDDDGVILMMMKMMMTIPLKSGCLGVDNDVSLTSLSNLKRFNTADVL